MCKFLECSSELFILKCLLLWSISCPVVPQPKTQKLIDYSELGDLKDIIVRSDIWKDKFYYIFRNETIFNGCMAILMPIRNQVMHSRGKLFDEQQIKALEVNYSVKKFNL